MTSPDDREYPSRFYDPEAQPEMPEISQPEVKRQRLEPWHLWLLVRMRHPLMIPIYSLAGFAVLLVVITVAVQGRRVAVAEASFRRIVSEYCRQLSEEEASPDFQAMAAGLETVIAASHRSSSGLFGFAVSDARQLSRRSRALSRALTMVGESQPGAKRQESLMRLQSALARSGVEDDGRVDLAHLRLRNCHEWEERLLAVGMVLVDEGRSPDWAAWIEDVDACERCRPHGASGLRHAVLSHYLARLERRWQRGALMSNYGEEFAAAHNIFDSLQSHRCPADDPNPPCRKRWEDVCYNLFSNWHADVRTRAEAGQNVTALADQFAGLQEEAMILPGFNSFYAAVFGIARQGRSR